MTVAERNLRIADSERLGRIIRARREYLALSPGAVAKKAGLARWSIQQIERGDVRPMFLTVALIFSALDMELSELLTLEAAQ